MKDLRKLLPILLAGVTGIIVLLIGNNPLGGGGELPPAPQPVVVPTSVDDDLPIGRLQYLPTQLLGDQLIHQQYYTVSYSSKHQNPEWVAYELQGARLEQEFQQERGSFHDDPRANDASSSAYRHSGYDRGHMVPAHDMNFNEQAMRESFYMSNVTPQVPDFNRGIWKSLENRVRTWAKIERRVYVIAGPLLRKRVRNEQRIKGTGPTFPRGFFKIIVDYEGREKKGIAFMFKNKDIDQPLENFVTSIDRVESYTGLDFFPELSEREQRNIEATADITRWSSSNDRPNL
ncbi:MAG: DNA/RNA non-specific endonuclease [Aureispira sp.]